MYKLCFYVPVADVDVVKQAIFAAGAGRIGEYDCCCWQSVGTGQFKPSAAANPAIGECGKLTLVEEAKVELVLEDDLIKPVVQALIDAHPYEEPAYQFWKVLTLEDL